MGLDRRLGVVGSDAFHLHQGRARGCVPGDAANQTVSECDVVYVIENPPLQP